MRKCIALTHKGYYTFGVWIECLPTAWQHSITGDEIRAVISYPLLRYGITTAYPDADTYMFVGNKINNEPWIEVAAEDEDGHTWAVFHAMMLTPRVAGEVYDISAGIIDLRNDLSPQRPYIGPQYVREEEM
jgi:hypothetical protein